MLYSTVLCQVPKYTNTFQAIDCLSIDKAVKVSRKHARSDTLCAYSSHNVVIMAEEEEYWVGTYSYSVDLIV